MSFTAGLIAAVLTFVPALQAVSDAWTEYSMPPLPTSDAVVGVVATDPDTLYILTQTSTAQRLFRYRFLVNLPAVAVAELPCNGWFSSDLAFVPGPAPGTGHVCFNSATGFLRYNIVTGVSSALPAPGPGFYNWTCDIAGAPGALYAMFLPDPLTYALIFRRYDIGTDSWTTLSPPPGGLFNELEGVNFTYSPAGGGSIFLIPNWPEFQGLILRYDTSTDAWSSSAGPSPSIRPLPMVGGRSIGSGSGNAVYVAGYAFSSSSPPVFARYDPTSDNWTTLATPPGAPFAIPDLSWPGGGANRLHTVIQGPTPHYWIYWSAPPPPDPSPSPSPSTEPVPPAASGRPDSGGGCHGSVAASWMAGAALAGLLALRRVQ